MSSSFFDYLAKYSYSIFITLNINLKLKQKIQSAWGNKGLKKQKRHFRGSWLSIYLTLWHAKTNSVSKFQTSANYGCLEKWDKVFFSNRRTERRTDRLTFKHIRVKQYTTLSFGAGVWKQNTVYLVFFFSRVAKFADMGKKRIKKRPRK